MVDFISQFYLYIDWGSNNKGSATQKIMSQQIITQQITSKIPSLSNKERLTKQTQDLLQKFPDTSEIEFVYEDKMKGSAKRPKKNKKKK